MELSPSMQSFGAKVKELEDYWNGEEFRCTIEFSTSKEDLADKLNVLADSSERLQAGRWIIHKCDTCAGYSNGESPMHVEILYCKDFDDLWKQDSELYKIRKELKATQKKLHNLEVYPTGAVEDLIEDFERHTETPELYNSYRELTLWRDNNEHHIREAI